MALADTTYRQATIHDAGAIAEVINRIVQEPDPVGLAGPTTAEGVRTWLTRQGGEGGIFLCLVEGKVAGFSALDFDTQEPDTATLGVWVRPEPRRGGLGTTAAEYALGFARDRGYRRLRGRLPEHNDV